jgi:adenylate cyclase
MLWGHMADYSRAEAATRAGVEPPYLDRLIKLELLTPDADDRLRRTDIRKAQTLRTLEDAGIPPERVAEGLGPMGLSLAFLESPVYERFAAFGDDTFRTLSQRTGLPLELLMVIREAAGGAVPGPDDRVREDEALVVPYIRIGLAMGYTPRSIERGV